MIPSQPDSMLTPKELELDPKIRIPQKTSSSWRSQNIGPTFFKLGRRVLEDEEPRGRRGAERAGNPRDARAPNRHGDQREHRVRSPHAHASARLITTRFATT